ncbi:PKD-like family lipoprotein [Pedobacter sp. MW01-1-1]|uniref:PKD-like family lipoprotein n=1 Tax=Pedobacter sp. MW01-1-1 TaxID=3383027 RepID=UPI003FEEDF04
MSLKLNNRSLLMGLIAATFLLGCKKDKSTEASMEVNKVGVTGENGPTITVFQNATLSIAPTVTLSMPNKKENMEYTWLAYQNNPSVGITSPRFVISNDAVLSYVIKPELFILGEPYVVRFEARDKETGISAYINYNIVIGNKFSGAGLMVLVDKNGLGDISYVFQDKSVQHNVYSAINSTPLLKPRKLEIITTNIEDEITAGGKRIYLLAETGSQEVSYTNLIRKFDYSTLFFSPPNVSKPSVMKWQGSTGVFIGDGKVHINISGGFPGQKKWGVSLLNPDGDLNYDLAPYSVGGTNVSAMVYDNTSKRFFLAPSSGVKLQNFSPSVSGPAFNLHNVGMTMLYLDSASSANEYNAIMKGADNLPYRLKVKTVNTSAASPNLSVEKVQMNAPDILNMSAAAASTTANYIYYGTENVLRTYAIGTNDIQGTYSFPSTEKITAMRFSRSVLQGTERAPRLAVATWDGTQGRLYFFKVANFGVIGEFTDRLEGFGKVVDMGIKF